MVRRLSQVGFQTHWPDVSGRSTGSAEVEACSFIRQVSRDCVILTGCFTVHGQNGDPDCSSGDQEGERPSGDGNVGQSLEREVPGNIESGWRIPPGTKEEFGT